MELLEFHPIAAAFPLLEGSEFNELLQSVRESGLREAITTYDGKILDGRNRFRVCAELNIAPQTEPYTGDDPVGFVVEKNLAHHRLSDSQRALIGAKLVTVRSGENQHTLFKASGVITLKRAGDLLRISPGLVSLARLILDKGTPEQIEAVRSGATTVWNVGMALRANSPREPREPHKVDRQAKRTSTLRLQAQLWGHLREALKHLAELPLPSEVVSTARRHDSAGLIERRLDKSIQWLEGFKHAWRNRDEDAA